MLPRALALCCALMLPLAAAATPFHDDFADPGLPGWQVDASDGNTVEVVDGRLRIESRLNQHAHIEREIGRDLVTVSAVMQPSVPSGVSWSSGIFLYWAPGAWCQLSIIDPQDGLYYVAEALGGQPMEHYLDPCDRSRPHGLRIELGKDCVRYYARVGDEDWAVQRVTSRPDEWLGAPRLLVVGKGYGSNHDAAYSAPDLDNDYADPSVVTVQWFDEVTIEPTPRDRLKLRRDELAPAGDVVGEALLAEAGDPTYEQVAAVYPPLKHVREAVGTKWHPYEIGVTETGSVELPTAAGALAIGTMTVGDDYTPFGSGPERPVKRLLDGHLPVVLATWAHDGVEYEQMVLGYADGFSDREPLRAYVHLRATSTTGARTVRVGFRVEPKSTGVLAASSVLELPAEGSEKWAVMLPCPVEFGSIAEDVCPCDAEAWMLATRGFWRREHAKGMQISVPDERLMDGHRAWLAYNAIDVDRVGDLYEPHDGAHFYEEVYGYSAARYAWVLDLWGRHDEAEAVLATLMNHQSPEGLLDWNFGLTDTGTLLIAMAVHYETTGDVDWLRANADSALNACEWLTTHRAETRDAEPRVRGLIKHRSYCDYAAPVFSQLHNCYCAAGMGRIADALAEVGIDSRAIAREATTYRRDVLASMRASTVTVNGRKVIPIEPDTYRLLKDSSYESRNYYGLVASTLLECGFPGPRSKEAKQIARFLREAGGILLGTSEFVGGIDHAYGYGYMEHQLIHNRPERYLLGLYAGLAYGMSRETFSSVECTQVKTGENAMTLPHLYSGSQQLFMLRTMLLREDENRLVLCSAAPRDWLRDGEVIRVDDAPTRFGNASFRIDSELGQGRVRAGIECEALRGLKQIVLHLRHPDGAAISRVTVNGRKWADHADGTITLDASASPLHVVAYY